MRCETNRRERRTAFGSGDRGQYRQRRRAGARLAQRRRRPSACSAAKCSFSIASSRPAKTNNLPFTAEALRLGQGPAGHHPHPGRRRRQAPALPAPAPGGESLPRCPRRALLRRARGTDPLPAAGHPARRRRRGRLKIMVPMVTACGGGGLVRRLLAEAAAELRRRRDRPRPRIELGIMVETPAAALSIDQPGARGRLLQHRQQRPAAVRPGRRPRQRRSGRTLRPAASGLPAPAAAGGRGRPGRPKRWLGICGEMAGNPGLPAAAGGLRLRRTQHGAGPLIPAARKRLRQLDATSAAACCARHALRRRRRSRPTLLRRV